MRHSQSYTCAPGKMRRGLLQFSAALAATLLLPAYAAASTLVVDDDGTYDAGTDGCDGADASFTTINDANTAAIDGDTIFVCPGTYVEVQIHITKAITLQGSGAGSTFIDGGGLSSLTSAGTVRINTNSGDVAIDGFTIQNPSSTAGGLSFGIQGKSSAPVTFTITNNVIKGTNNPAATQDYGVYTDGPSALEAWVFQYNTIMETGSNPILIERHPGPTDFSYNTFDRGVSQNGVSAYFHMSHSGTAITSLQRVSNNTINLANDPGPYVVGNGSGAITFYGAFTGGTIGTFSNVEITGNTITGLEAYRRGITLVNNGVAPGTNGVISNAVISCNQISGNATPQVGSFGIRLFGDISAPQITGNDISGVETAFTGRTQNTHIASGVALNENSFTNIGLNAIDWWSTVSLDAETNWFDDASGPTEAGNPAGTGGAIVATGGPALGNPVVDYVPWLGSGTDSDAGTCFVPGVSGICAGPSSCDQFGCSAPPANAGAVCNAASDVCEQDALCDGLSAVCPPNPTLPDTDSDGDCDAIDSCTTLDPGQVFSTKPKSRVVLSKINTDATPGNDSLVISAFFFLPPARSFSELTPLTDGVRVVLVAGDGTQRLDVTVPGGAYSTVTKVGWKLAPNGKTWTFVDRNSTPATGINQVVINNKDTAKTPRRVKITVKGKKSTFPVVTADSPIQATVTLGDATAAAAGLCGESAYTAPDCKFNVPQNRLTCRR